MEMNVRQEQLSFTFLLLFLVIKCNCLDSESEPKVQIGSWTLTLIDSDESHRNSTNHLKPTTSPPFPARNYFSNEYESNYNSSSQFSDANVAASTPRRYITSSQSRRIVRVKKHRRARRKSTRSPRESRYEPQGSRPNQKLVRSESRHRNDAHRRHSYRSHRHRHHTTPHDHRSVRSHHHEDGEHYGYRPHRHYRHNHRDGPQDSDRFGPESAPLSPPLSTEGSSIVTDSDYNDGEIINPEGEPLSGDVITDEQPISDVTESYPESPNEYRTIEGYPPIDHQQYHPDYHHHAPNPEDNYPTPWSPSTHFRCDEVEFPGYYADIEAGCQVWHICEPDGRHHRMSCPRETLFNQVHKVCDWWYNVECERSTEYYHLNRDMFGGQPFYGHEYRNGPTRYPDQEEVVWGRHTSSYDSPRRSVISLTSNGMDAYEYPLNTDGESTMDYAASTKKTSRDESHQLPMISRKPKKSRMTTKPSSTAASRNSRKQSSRKVEKSSKQDNSRDFD